jgi:hypothetical protein
MKTKLSLSNNLKTKLETSLKVKIIVGASAFCIVLSAIIFSISNFGIQQQSTAAIFPSGTYRIGGTGTTPSAGCSYVNLKYALNDLNGKTINGPVTFILTSTYSCSGETYPLTFNNIAGSSTTNRITIKPDAGANITISGTSATSILTFNAGSYYTLDGYGTDSSSRHLTIINNSSAANTCAIWVKSLGANNGCRNLIIKNCNIAAYKSTNSASPSFGIFAGGTSIGDGSYTVGKMGADNDNLSIINNKIYRASWAIWGAGTSSGNMDNLLIKNNILGGDAAADYLTLQGLDLNYINNAQITGNRIYNIISNIGTGVYYPTGMWIGTLNNTIITKNVIKTIQYTGNQKYAGAGIELNNTYANSNILIANNAISDLKGKGGNNILTGVCGIRVFDNDGGGSMDNLRIYFNSINITTGNSANGSKCSNIFLGEGITNVDIRNNALINTLYASGNSINKYGVYCNSSNLPFSEINYNNYYCPDGNVGYFNGTIETLSEWRDITGDDLRSVYADPGFTSATDLTPNISLPNVWYLHGNGCQIPEINYDILGHPRSITAAGGSTDIGAYEFDHSNLPTPPPVVISSTSIADGVPTVFKVGEMTIASILWHGSNLPTSAIAKYYSGTYVTGLNPEDQISNAYWDITATGGSGFTYDITLYYDAAIFGTLIDEATMAIAKQHETDPWVVFSNCVLNVTEKTITYTGLSTFSKYTLKDGGQHLPISLMSFSGKQNEDNIDLAWKTASEINNDYFTLERSEDCKTFESIGKVNGAGNSNMVLKYDFIDKDAVKNAKVSRLYYRLKQTDFDGKFTYSGIISILLNTESGSGIEILSASPNPFKNDVFLSFSSISDGPALMKLYDMNGKLVKVQETEAMEGINTLTLSDNASLPKGMYFINVEMNNVKTKIVKLVKN